VSIHGLWSKTGNCVRLSRLLEKKRQRKSQDPWGAFAPAVREWFSGSFPGLTEAQAKGWPSILAGQSTLLLAPTGSGKTLAAFLAAIDKLMFSKEPAKKERCRVLYISPLKALAVDVERNLRAPIAGIAAVAERLGERYRVPSLAIRSGDTPQKERAQISRHPPDILITTPESLYLLLTSNAREILASVETVIVDEIHSLVPTKRGTHLFLSIERLEHLRASKGQTPPLQRIGLSATQRPLEEVARLLGGGTVAENKPAGSKWSPRPVAIVDAGRKKSIQVQVEVPVEDMARLGEMEDIPSGPASAGPQRKSIWPSIYPRILEHIRAHKTTMVFVNSRRLAERMANAVNELAGEEVALAHHGSIAREQRQQIEDRLKRGTLPSIVATSSLELGIDMGAVDLVIQIEAPPSIASGLQRIGRASHQVGGVPAGVIFPKYRGDLLASAAAVSHMLDGKIEETFYPRNPLDVLAQQIVAIASIETMSVEELFNLIRCAAPFAELPRSSFDGVLDMLSGRYPSDEFAELRPRIIWDRVAGTVRARQGAKQIAVINAGTIPDRGLYGVFLADGDAKHSRRVGELDEEMVFESKPGEVFLLGASSWRIEDITHDRVLVTPAPGEPGKMPFWHGDRAGRPIDFGRAIGELSRELVKAPRKEALRGLRDKNNLDEKAARNLLDYLRDQADASGELPSDRTIVVERFLDELGDWRICILSPFGARVHAPWATAVVAKWHAQSDSEIDMIWSDDGIVFRLPETENPPEVSIFIPTPEEIEGLVVGNLGQTSLFAARFRENAARALLLPRRRAGQRSPLWSQRKRASDLLSVAAKYGSFPILLETYRECLRDVFDLPGLTDLLSRIASRQIRVVTVDSRAPSPFASSLLFSYVANFIYDGDAPLAERRAQALSIDQSQLKELLGEAELRELLDAGAIAEYENHLQRLDESYPVRHADGLHDLLLSLGDLTEREIIRRAGKEKTEKEIRAFLKQLIGEKRAIELSAAGEKRFAAAEDAARFRDALGIVTPLGLPEAFLQGVNDALGDLVSRYARTHGPFRVEDAATRFGLGVAPVRAALERLQAADRVLEGEFLPGGRSREWIDSEVLRALKRRSLAKLRKQIEPVEPAVLGRFLLDWQGLTRPRLGLDHLLSVVEQLQGVPIPASVLESEILPARIQNFRPSDLDLLCSAGEVVWRGIDPIGAHDGRIALFLTDRYRLLAAPTVHAEGELESKIRGLLEQRGALFFSDLVTETGAFSEDVLAALWKLVWAGEVSNDTLAPMRAVSGGKTERKKTFRGRSFRSRRTGPPGSEGRWTLLPQIGLVLGDGRKGPSETERRTALANQLLERYGIVTREALHTEGVFGGFSTVYEVLKAMEESGRIRRGYFIAGQGATQFALPGADERLRSLREAPDEVHTLILAATDPANPYGATVPWPVRRNADASTNDRGGEGEAMTRPQRAAGARVILHNGALVAWIAKSERNLLTFLPEAEPDRSHAIEAIIHALTELVQAGKRRAFLVTAIDGEPVETSVLAIHLRDAGFVQTSRGFLLRRVPGEGQLVYEG
jgi:ATP-dependent Lhr-like helicase